MSEQKSESGETKPAARLRKTLILSVIASLGVFAALSIYADIGEVGSAFAGFRWRYIPLILGLTCLNYLLRFCKWHYYLGRIGIGIRGRESLVIFLSGLSMSVTPAKLGEVFKSYLLKRLQGTEMSRTVPVVVAERVTDVLGLLILAAISFSALEYGLKALIVVLAVLLMMIAILQSRKMSLGLLGALRAIPFVRRLSGSLTVAYESACALFRLRVLLTAVSISVISWGLECFAMYFVLTAFGSSASLLSSTFVFSFSSLAGAVSMIPGGLGVAEASCAGLLMLAGISRGVAAGATVIIRFCTLWFGVLVGLITMFLTRQRWA